MNPAKPPTEATLRRYGLTAEEWLAYLEAQGGVCAVCEKVPSTGRFVTDHEHVRGWKKMPPDQRKLYVRGVLCWFCNASYLAKAITAKKARNIAAYLDRYAARRPQKGEAA